VSYHNLFARYRAAVAKRGWIRPGNFCCWLHIRTLSCGSCNTWMDSTGNFCCWLQYTCTPSCGSCSTWIDRPALFAAWLQRVFPRCHAAVAIRGFSRQFCCWLRIFFSKHISGLTLSPWQKCQFTFSILWRCQQCDGGSLYQFRLTSTNRTCCNNFEYNRIIKYVSTLNVTRGANDAQHILLWSCRLLRDICPAVLFIPG